ncbi:MAG: GNAT family acetyltransferase [Chloroflexota bacterium]
MDIRPFQAADGEALVRLWQACGLVRPWNDAKMDIQRKLAVDPELLLVGEIDGHIVASVMGGYEGHRGWINYLAVLPSQQAHGYGREMVAAIEERLLAAGCPKVNLQIRDSNLDAMRFYEAIGYSRDPVISYGKRLIVDE